MPSPAAEAFANATVELRDKENAVRQFRLHLVTVAAGALALSASLWSAPPSVAAVTSWAAHLMSVFSGVLGMHWGTTYELAAQTRETLNVAGVMPDAKQHPKPKSWHRAASQWSYRVQLATFLLGLFLLAVARLLEE